jgi:hypothetical protein
MVAAKTNDLFTARRVLLTCGENCRRAENG